MNLVNIGISPPNNKVVVSTTTKVELIIRLALGDSFLLIYRLSAKAMAPLMIPLNQIRVSCFKLKPISNRLQMPKNKAGRNTPQALAIMQEISKKNTNA